MAWKNIKDHYRIGHIVKAGDNCIKIGSPYVSDILTILPDGSLKWGLLGPSDNDDLARYHAEMSADPAKLRELYHAPDTFSISLPVYTYQGAEIIEKQCEAYDWPNVTHDGHIQYENTYSRHKDEVIGWAKHNAALGMKMFRRHIRETTQRLKEQEIQLAKEELILASLDRDHPHIPCPTVNDD
jgi:hypothetical protein